MMSDRSEVTVGRCRVGTAVVHRVTDLDARRKPVEDNPANLALKNAHQCCVVFQILVGSMNRGCQMAVKTSGVFHHLIS